MALVALLIAFGLEFYVKWGAEYRQFGWFAAYRNKLHELFGGGAFVQSAFGVIVLLSLPVIAISLFLGIFPSMFHGLFLLAISFVVLFYCLGPKPLKETYEHYFESMERGDAEAAYLSLKDAGLTNDFPEGENVIRNATRSLLVESQKRYFGVVFWFIWLGPWGALFYRLAFEYQALLKKRKEDEVVRTDEPTDVNLENEDEVTNSDEKQAIDHVIHFIDWLPSRFTSLLFLLTADFVNGFYRLRDFLFNTNASNQHVISETGLAALNLDRQPDDLDDYKENRLAMSMVERTGIIYLIAAVLLSPLSFW